MIINVNITNLKLDISIKSAPQLVNYMLPCICSAFSLFLLVFFMFKTTFINKDSLGVLLRHIKETSVESKD